MQGYTTANATSRSNLGHALATFLPVVSVTWQKTTSGSRGLFWFESVGIQFTMVGKAGWWVQLVAVAVGTVAVAVGTCGCLVMSWWIRKHREWG